MTDIIPARGRTRLVAMRRAATLAICTVFIRWAQRRRQRMALLELSDDHLGLVGIHKSARM